MLEILVAFAACVLGQAPQSPADDARARAVAPFVDPDVLAVVQLDLARLDVGALATRLAGDRPPGLVAERTRLLTSLSEGLKQAGTREVFLIISLDDLPGPPVAVVPIIPGSDAARIGRLLCGPGDPSSPPMFPACATIHDAVVAGTPRAIERVRGLKPGPRPELAAAFASVEDETMSLRIALIPSPDTRRVFEEIVPELPRELGGGPITDLTRGVLWVAAGLDASRPSMRLVIASPSAQAANILPARGRAFTALLEKSPWEGDFARLVSRLRTEVAGDRIRVTADADVAADLVSSVLEPVRESAIRSVCSNNEKQIILAIHNYNASHKDAFPPAYSTSPDGKPLLSWRVLILPYLDQQGSLYKEFHLDEPWDSPHNRALIARMPEVYRCPMESTEAARAGKTRYVAPRGTGTFFRGAQPINVKEITDGTSYTIAFIDGGDDRAVPWTKPDDWDVSPAATDPFRGIFEAHRSRRRHGTTAAMADGAVRFLTDKIKPATLRALLTVAGNEVVSPEDF
jgi:hypothetical protein